MACEKGRDGGERRKSMVASGEKEREAHLSKRLGFAAD